MAKKTTADLIDQSERLIQRLVMAEGITDGQIDAELEALAIDIEDKADSWAFVVKSAKSQVDFYKKEIAALTARKNNRERVIERARFQMLELMKRHEVTKGESKIKTDRSTVWISERAQLSIWDLDGFVHLNRSADFITWEPKIDKKAVLKAIEGGILIEGAHIVNSKSVSFR